MMRRRGLTSKQFENLWREGVFRYVATPLLILFGIFVVATVLQGMLEIETSLFPKIFTAVGGIPMIILYFKKQPEIRRLLKK